MSLDVVLPAVLTACLSVALVSVLVPAVLGLWGKLWR